MSVEEFSPAPIQVTQSEDEVTRIREMLQRLPEPVQDVLVKTGQRFPLLRRAAFGFLPTPQTPPAKRK